MNDRLATSPANEAYECGWREGGAAALAAVEREGLEAVRARERSLAPILMTLAFEPRDGEEAVLGAP